MFARCVYIVALNTSEEEHDFLIDAFIYKLIS
jgi:hypothetical protein